MSLVVISDFSRLESLYHTVRDVSLRLFVNDHEPTGADTVKEFVEAEFPGYAPIPIGHDDWTVSGFRLTLPILVFALNEDLDLRVLVQGWYLSRGDDVVMAGCVDEKPHRLVNKGDKIKVRGINIGG